MPRVKIFSLGPPKVLIEGKPIGIQRRKVKALLTYLAVTGKRCHREKLATMLWPNSDQKRAHGSLRRNLSELNKILEGDWLDIDQETVTLRHSVDLWLDVTQFRQSLAQCQTHAHALATVCRACITLLNEAVTLYRDDFLLGFALPNCPEFDEWQFFQTESYRQMLATALERLIQAHLDHDEPVAAIPHARRRLNLDPLHEPTHRQLMNLYALTGQKSAALRQYHRCVRILKEELGVSPTVETTTLFERLRSNGLDDTGKGLFAPNSRHNLPTPTTPFVGRETEQIELNALCADPDVRLITFLGPGGMGKTRLALEVAAGQVETYQNGVYFVSLAQLREMDHILPTIAEAVGFRFQDDERPPKQQLLDFLNQKQMLLVLDNFEHLLDGAGFVNEILQAGREIKIFVTSRERLQLSGETVYTLGSMGFPTWETPKDALQYSSIKLFMQTAQRSQPGFEFKENDLQYVARICRLVGGMPLGIVLAAAWVQILSPEEIAAEITQSLDLLETELRDIPERQRSIRIAFEYSWHRLTVMERDMYMRISVFRGGFTRMSAKMITGISLQTLAGLVNKSFVQSTPGGRYEVHELLRQFAEEQLDTSKQTHTAYEAHGTYYLSFLRRCEADLAGDQQLVVLAKLEADLENIRAAWYWAVRERNYALIDLALEGMYRWFWLRRDRQQEGRDWLRFARKQLAPALGEEPHPVWGRISARILDQEGPWFTKIDQAKRRIEGALAIAQQHGADVEVAFCLWALGHANMGVADHTTYERVITYFEQSLEQYQTLDNRFYSAQLLQDMGHCYRRMWQVEKALVCLKDSFQLRHEMGDKIGLGHCLRELGWAAYLDGDVVNAKTYWQQAYAIRGEVGGQQEAADSMFTLSLLSLTKGDWEEGKRLAEEALEIAQEVGSVLHKRWAMRELEIAACMEATEQSTGLHLPATPNTITQFEVTLFHLIFGTIGSVNFKQQLHRALKIAAQEIDLVRCLPFVSMQLAREGEPEWAVCLLSLASNHPEYTSGWLEKLPMVRSIHSDLEAAVPRDVFSSAWERGQTLNRKATIAQLLARFGDQ
jgi:predicted ATPase/DNA-binding SARP family transcriptional activator